MMASVGINGVESVHDESVPAWGVGEATDGG